ncbi:unnamed protein product [Allacma fusca]|uniref:Uncharacterized protein n=1 Tax=Allacma fusca TaxID=39272 RepID=A0A8J2PK94_9HEXA|nr:unnamed protein product [Allacma fusca]
MVLCRLFASAKKEFPALIPSTNNHSIYFSASQEVLYGAARLVEQYREFSVIFVNNREITNDLELLESIVQESKIRNDDTLHRGVGFEWKVYEG